MEKKRKSEEEDGSRKYGKVPWTGATALVPVCTRKRRSNRHGDGTDVRLIMISLAALRVSIPCNNLKMFDFIGKDKRNRRKDKRNRRKDKRNRRKETETEEKIRGTEEKKQKQKKR